MNSQLECKHEFGFEKSCFGGEGFNIFTSKPAVIRRKPLGGDMRALNLGVVLWSVARVRNRFLLTAYFVLNVVLGKKCHALEVLPIRVQSVSAAKKFLEAETSVLFPVKQFVNSET